MVEGDIVGDEDPRAAAFRETFLQSEAKIAGLFSEEREDAMDVDGAPEKDQNAVSGTNSFNTRSAHLAAPKRPVRKIDEDDYDDDDDDDDDAPEEVSPLKAKSLALATLSSTTTSSPLRTHTYPLKPTSDTPKGASAEQGKSAEDVRKRLEEDKKAAEDAAKRSFHTLFYTLENDRDAMLEQQRLEEMDRQIEAEISGNGNSGSSIANGNTASAAQGKLSSTNLGASNLTLKHLINQVDTNRNRVQASDTDLRSLFNEVKKDRSKWANPDKPKQGDLYDALEKVLNELKAMTTHSTAFLSRVNKREAPDYYNIIKHPMDLGSMTKKLKSISYKSKAEFVDDLNLIWDNCLRYNADPSHFLRKHALAMRKETDKLVPLIPEIVVKDRAELEAEERRRQNTDADGGEESDDEPIMSSRGRKAPSKKAKKGMTTTEHETNAQGEETPDPDAKPLGTSLPSSSSLSNLKDSVRAGSDTLGEGTQNGLSTPPPRTQGNVTPALPNGTSGSLPPGSQSDVMEVDSTGAAVNGVGAGQALHSQEEPEYEDLEYQTWKQVTKKDRALVAAERHRLFRNNQFNIDEPALLRTKAGMRRWQKNQRLADVEGASGGKSRGDAKDEQEVAQGGETLAEGMEGDDQRVLPDYYDTLAAMPDIPDRLKWVEDADGQLVDQSEEFLHMIPKRYFTAPESSLTQKIDGNMRQMQDTRKICSKIGVIKQMQLQSQMYQNQFQKYNPEPFVEADIAPHVSSDDGAIMNQSVVRAALQRSVGKIFYHAGFEEFQPSALDAVTDIASDYFTRLASTLEIYGEIPKEPSAASASTETDLKTKFTTEECILHCLYENGHDVTSLESYCTEDIERQGSKLTVMHERMKAHLADLLRPALTDAGPDGSHAFNDGSEQFVGGDFAEDLNEDFFGFHELGLDKEFGLSSLSVPLHLLQNRMHNAYQAQNTTNAVSSEISLEQLPAYDPVNLQNLKSQIGLVQNFFLAKLHANGDEPLVEDEDLPQKQRFPKPKLPATGKISSPRKRPLKEQQSMNKTKKKKMEGSGGAKDDGNQDVRFAPGAPGSAAAGHGPSEGAVKPVSKLKLSTSSSFSNRNGSFDGTADNPTTGAGSGRRESEKDDGAENGVGMISPESIVVA
ncbi:MAG: Transcriptional activator spt7 [Chaenotheca gracillima]|nr:MAG: Transcriptional activator spt7 [Chaenotheca gracillima]